MRYPRWLILRHRRQTISKNLREQNDMAQRIFKGRKRNPVELSHPYKIVHSYGEIARGRCSLRYQVEPRYAVDDIEWRLG